MTELMRLAISLMGYGLAGVFLVLALFIVIITLLVRVFPQKEQKETGAP